MLNVSRALIFAMLAAFVATGTSVAGTTSATPPTTSTGKSANNGGGGKCGQTPKGCHKNDNQPNAHKTTNNGNGKCGQTPKGCHKNQPKPGTSAQPMSAPMTKPTLPVKTPKPSGR